MKKIIFDLDNTLLFISNDWNLYYQKFIDKYKFKITPEELYSTIGSGNILPIKPSKRGLESIIEDNNDRTKLGI